MEMTRLWNNCDKVCDSKLFFKVMKPLPPDLSVDKDKIDKGENGKILRKETKEVKILISFFSFFSKISQIKNSY